MEISITLNYFLAKNKKINSTLKDISLHKADGLSQLEAHSGINYNVFQTASTICSIINHFQNH